MMTAHWGEELSVGDDRRQNQAPRVSEAALKRYCIDMLVHVGVPDGDARIVAENLVEADLRSVSSHGVVRFPIYVQRILDGGTNPRANIRVVRQTRTTAVVDGDNGLGHLVGVRAMEIALEKGSDGDCAFVSVRNSNHFGAAGYYAEMAARADMIGLSFTIGAINHMAPWGGAEAVLGNNPLAFAFPTTEGFPIVLDMACSNAARALLGFVIPLGGPKGYALTLAVGLLSTMLSGAAFGREVGDLYEQTTTAQNCGHLFGVLPIAAFEDMDVYKERMARAIVDIRGVKLATGHERVYLPGEREHLSLVERRRHGIELGPQLARELADLGARHGVALELEHA